MRIPSLSPVGTIRAKRRYSCARKRAGRPPDADFPHARGREMDATTKAWLLGMSFALPMAATASPAADEKDHHAQHAHPTAHATPAGRGAHLETGCAEASQQAFDQGFYFLHNMSYTRARGTFEQGATADPACAMLFWGAAMTYFQPLWPGKPDVAALAKGTQAAATARTAARNAIDRDYAAAVSAFYDGEGVDYQVRLKNWEAGQRTLAEKYPEDVEAQAFHALSQLAIVDRKDKSYAVAIAVGADLERLLQQRPEHPGLMHYLVHAYDNPALAKQATTVSADYMATSPDAPHALHMPSHIYTRLGDWPKMIDANIRSADEALRNPTANGLVLKDFFHAADYLVYAYLQTGDDARADATAARIDPTKPFEQGYGAAEYALVAIPARLALERRNYKRAAMVTPIGAPYDLEKFPWFGAIPHAVRGLGAARRGQLKAAAAEIAELDRLRGKVDKPWWAEQIRNQRDIIAAWVAWARKDKAAAEALAREAAAREFAAGKDPVEPGHVIVAIEEYADMLLALDRPQDALAQYESSLRESPNRFAALYGAARAAESAGLDDKAQAHYARLLEIASPESTRPELAHARKFLAKKK